MRDALIISDTTRGRLSARKKRAGEKRRSPERLGAAERGKGLGEVCVTPAQMPTRARERERRETKAKRKCPPVKRNLGLGKAFGLGKGSPGCCQSTPMRDDRSG